MKGQYKEPLHIKKNLEELLAQENIDRAAKHLVFGLYVLLCFDARTKEAKRMAEQWRRDFVQLSIAELIELAMLEANLQNVDWKGHFDELLERYNTVKRSLKR